MRRAAALQAIGEIENLEQAVRDVEKAYELSDGSRETKATLREAKGMLKNAKRKDFYKIIGQSVSVPVRSFVCWFVR